MATYRLEDYQFELPPERIAQTPAARRDESALLVSGGVGSIQHTHFHALPRYLRAGDVLVLNQTRVINARCFGYKDTGTKIEMFVLGMPVDPAATWVLAKPSKRLKVGQTLHFRQADVHVEIVEKGALGKWCMAFPSFEALQAVMAGDGELPLPPYIKRETGPGQDDYDRYQTVFARELGAVAAPTAGLHFTDALLAQVEALGVTVAKVTHHVGIGTFKPLIAEDVREHIMEGEQYTMTPETAALLAQAKQEGRRIIAVGTTSTRCLEANLQQFGCFTAGTHVTDLYIYPGYRFLALNGLITNFHLPGSSLILLVSALMGRERIMHIYEQALERDYRFYSYGDAMLLLPDEGDLSL
ncbi:tRNA preQ1(34) S-adenosylmethionine ribosyltransferase-isomerase QueA [Acanthopleuribacter pedis]|uniref:S-adenosylmethionine:tRNA ribosyltransferase-isomerase n=1 Tax=Acanthopleuribacter pedis TaxID=442870 RepID=A0A8J7U536_9BACT|nr:tRNA preQ1(34) S-adenosylmethionine ribosyltransferase-isomerase QueA [Acanthopleuribacter pedis]MBO1320083.1 tRNA preQ1(34) S-adenosylmethionine ribosyltransferase-isomerase QueA [Acanthopleuribacter pedis]